MLRVAVVCPAGRVAAWQQRCIDALIRSGAAECLAIIVSDVPPYPPQQPLFDFRALRVADVKIAGAPIARVAASDSRALAALDLDVELHFDQEPAAPGGARSAGAVTAARRGAWHFRFGPGPGCVAPACFLECDKIEPIVDIALVERSADTTVALRRGAVAIVPTSLETSVEHALAEAATWPAWACVAIAAGGEVDAGNMEPIAAPAEAVTTARAVALSIKLFGRRLAHAGDMLFADKWNVGVAPLPIERFLQTGDSWPDTEWLREADGLDYRADPFGATADGRTWALVERFDAAVARGRIEAFEIATRGWSEPAQPVMDGPAHMSYPFLLQHEGAWYCVPESLGEGNVSLLRAVSLPSRWEKVATLLDAEAVDATLVRYGDRWWLFCTDFDEPRHHRLRAFYADDLRGPYRPHALNPVKVDPRSAGCAGTPFIVDGVLYRPSQNCSRSYGGAIGINRVVELTPTAFREETAVVLSPHPRYPAGVHTLSAVGPMTLVDGKRRAFTLRRVVWRLSAPLRRFRPRG